MEGARNARIAWWSPREVTRSWTRRAALEPHGNNVAPNAERLDGRPASPTSGDRANLHPRDSGASRIERSDSSLGGNRSSHPETSAPPAPYAFHHPSSDLEA